MKTKKLSQIKPNNTPYDLRYSIFDLRRRGEEAVNEVAIIRKNAGRRRGI
ncbi:MAG TPA: hypothetical protein VG347_25815 [Verrucomicrobiae bacterium]|nr:hypothetical protein [Verrucomicrobiae bacterium]